VRTYPEAASEEWNFDLARCDFEIQEILSRDPEAQNPAYLSVLGLNNWTVERALIQRELEASGKSPQPLARTARTS
jgi:hypothetical protein